MTQEFSETAVKRMARRVLEIELEALELSKKSIDDQFLKAVDAFLSVRQMYFYAFYVKYASDDCRF